MSQTARQARPPLWSPPLLGALPGVKAAATNRAWGDLAGADAQAAANRERLRAALGLGGLAWAHQVHGTEILAVEDGGQGPLGEADGLATARPGLGLLIKQADCQAVVLAAPERGVIANLHVGWRGNAAGMPGKGVAFLRERYGVEPGELHAAVSPGLGACCGQFVNWREELPESFLAFKQGEDRFDLEAATRAQLITAGLAPERIETSGVCTVCDRDYYSYRRDHGTERFGTVIALARRS
ncbi:MAG: polyphenol oxidase family protein [Desulfarculaceae bacterium]|nr:polyphenol oxidase family protein [Desulfarculaceae bacterium]MCF8072613.1 polyphenol oxidase family protein [Desulfarculaceae bacterium]MCF8103315.1 polyphenol oxidase family protein [Desulfarculaceae bacterium]MCF8117797.1 polyphenol oxidase family protein [Desulfarculaceae bacterium]